jgi:imidazolonepropionase-like amidohydrolase
MRYLTSIRSSRAALVLAALVVSIPVATGQQAPAPAVALVGVNVIPMDRERVLDGHTLVVRDGVIAALGPAASVKVPEGALVVEARGKYVIPGLAEMHGHLQGGDTALGERILELNALYGVTTLRNMQGHPAHLTLRDRVNRRELLGPRLYTAGPALGGNIKTAEQAIQVVTEQKRAGFDLLKIQEGMSRPVFDAMADAAHRLKIPFAGHVPADVGLPRALEARYASIDHLDGYVEALVPPDAQADLNNAGFFGSSVAGKADLSRLGKIVADTKAAGTAVVPTETLIEQFFTPAPIESLFAKPALRYLPADMVAGWEKQKRSFMSGTGNIPEAQREQLYTLRRTIIRKLQDGGVRLVLGADSPQVLNVPGVAIHHELALMVKAGLTPYEALASGTRNVAAYFGTLESSGTVERGKRADLIVLDGDPLRDISRTEDRFGVFVNGRWIPRAEIDKRLAALAR